MYTQKYKQLNKIITFSFDNFSDVGMLELVALLIWILPSI